MLILALLIPAAVISLSCGTIMHGSSQNIGITSAPTGANVTIDNQKFGVTPLVADLSRKSDHIISFELEGYQKADLTITKSVSGWVWGNIIFGGLIGLVVDAISGGLYKLSPEQLNAELKKEGVSSTIKNEDLIIMTVLRPDPKWNKVGQLKLKE